MCSYPKAYQFSPPSIQKESTAQPQKPLLISILHLLPIRLLRVLLRGILLRRRLVGLLGRGGGIRLLVLLGRHLVLDVAELGLGDGGVSDAGDDEVDDVDDVEDPGEKKNRC